MSSILIKDMEMPTIELEWIIRHRADGKWYAIDTNAETTDGEWDEIISVPPHGRLIDADALKTEVFAHDKLMKDGWNNMDMGMFTGNLMEVIAAVPTIIPAEEGE